MVGTAEASDEGPHDIPTITALLSSVILGPRSAIDGVNRKIWVVAARFG